MTATIGDVPKEVEAEEILSRGELELSMTATIGDVPKEVEAEEILSRVPARDLKRLRSTCQSWNLLFKNRRFATNHWDKAAKEHLVLMLTKESRICPVSVNLHGTVPSLEVRSELSLIDPRSNAQFDFSRVFHCDGLLLCNSNDLSMLVVWNPCTGETRWIKAGRIRTASYLLGYSSSSSSKSYKVLSFSALNKCSQIYEFSSYSWRTLDHDITPQGWHFGCAESDHKVSLNGNIYGFAIDETETHPGIYLLRFDFSSERSSLLVGLPYQTRIFEIVSLSVVREEKLSVLLQPHCTSKTEIWVTNKIDDTTPVSWNKVLALDLSSDLQISSFGTFLLDEEKKVALCCERWNDMGDPTMDMDKIYCVGEDSKVTQVYLRVDTMDSDGPAILNYVPSLVQIEPVGANKRRRDD